MPSSPPLTILTPSPEVVAHIVAKDAERQRVSADHVDGLRRVLGISLISLGGALAAVATPMVGVQAHTNGIAEGMETTVALWSVATLALLSGAMLWGIHSTGQNGFRWMQGDQVKDVLDLELSEPEPRVQVQALPAVSPAEREQWRKELARKRAYLRQRQGLPPLPESTEPEAAAQTE